MKEETRAKREQLKALSQVIKMAIKEGATEAATVNEGLVMMYEEQGHTEIHSFRKWMELGKVVKKGEKALLLWGEPLKNQKQEKPSEGDEPDEYKFFPLAYVFSQLQVEPLKKTG